MGVFVCDFSSLRIVLGFFSFRGGSVGLCGEELGFDSEARV